MEAWAQELLREARIAHLATSTRSGVPHVVPICYAFHGSAIYSPIDEKPKRNPPQRLRRVRNILTNPHVCLVVDHYSEDWSELSYVLVRGLAELVPDGHEHAAAITLLRQKYSQYRSMQLERRPIIKIRITKVISWRPE